MDNKQVSSLEKLVVFSCTRGFLLIVLGFDYNLETKSVRDLLSSKSPLVGTTIDCVNEFHLN